MKPHHHHPISKVRFNLDLLLPFPKPVRRPDDNLRLQQQLLPIPGLPVRIQPRRPLGLRQQQYWHQILGLGLRHAPQPLVPVLPKDPSGPTLDVGDPGQVEQVGPGAGFEAVDRVLERGLEHAPAHPVAEVDHARGEALADLREGLHEAPGHLELAGDEVDGGFVAEVAQLQGGVEAAVDAGGGDLRGGRFREGFRAVRPVWCCSSETSFEYGRRSLGMLYIRFTKPGLTPTNSRTRSPLSSRPSICRRKMGQLMSVWEL